MRAQNTPMRRLLTLAGLAALGGLSGCTTVAKQAFQEWRGAHGKVFLVQPVDEDALRKYETVHIDRATSTAGDQLCPPELLHWYDRCAAQESLDLRDDYPGGQPMLHVAPEILYFQKKGILSGAELLARVKMFDDDSSNVVVDAIVRSESEAFRAGGEKALARANVEAIGKFLSARRLEEEGQEEGNEENQRKGR